MDAAKLKKLQDYSVILTQQAESKEAQGNKNEAVKDYVKLVDVLLLLANESKDHPTWQQLVNRAEYYQKKVRTMVDPERASSSNPLEMKQQQPDKVSMNEDKDKLASESSSSFNPFRKLPSLMGRKSDSKSSIENNSISTGASTTTVVSSWANDLDPKALSMKANPVQTAVTENEVVPRTLYSQVLEEKAALQRQVETLRNREKEFLAAIEEKEREFSQRISQMVPRSEFEELKGKLAESVPRSEYEEALTISAIPKERYMELHTQLGELQNKLQNSVSRALMDDLAEYVSFLVSTVSSVGDEKNAAKLSEEEQKEDGEKANEFR
ncbi:MAG: hypothetical protein PXY39_08760 [archaeon]|nr:hypothetical protein [archaeon]